ncbi:hypothetical protein [Microcoleus anatoxicus]
MPSTNIGVGGVGGAIGVGRDTGVIEIVVVPVDEVVVPVDEVVVPVDEVVVPVDEVVVPVDEVVVPVDEVVVPVDEVVVPVDEVVVPVDEVVVPVDEVVPINEGSVPVSRKKNDTALGIIRPPCGSIQTLNNRFSTSLLWVGSPTHPTIKFTPCGTGRKACS